MVCCPLRVMSRIRHNRDITDQYKARYSSRFGTDHLLCVNYLLAHCSRLAQVDGGTLWLWQCCQRVIVALSRVDAHELGETVEHPRIAWKKEEG